MTIDCEMDHVGMVIKDIDGAIKHFQRVGLELLKPPEQETLIADPPITFTACFLQNNAFRIKLIQPEPGRNVFRNYLDRYGDGIYYTGLQVKDLDREKRRLTGLGIPIIAKANSSDGIEMEVLFDTSKSGNVNIALFSENVPFPLFEPRPGNMKFHHLGFVVYDINKFNELYQQIGFKPVPPRARPPRDPNRPIDRQAMLNGWTIYGKIPKASDLGGMEQNQFQNKNATVNIGVNAPKGGKDLYAEYLEKHGEGMQHIHFTANDLPSELVKMVSNGFQCVLTQKAADGTLQESYYDTREHGNTFISIWNGTNPAPFPATPE